MLLFPSNYSTNINHGKNIRTLAFECSNDFSVIGFVLVIEAVDINELVPPKVILIFSL